MPTERAMKAALAVLEQTECGHMDRERSLVACDDCTASLIDRIAGLPELEARVAELEKHSAALNEECDIRHSQYVRMCEERDAALRRLEAVELWCNTTRHGFAASEVGDVLRLARGEK